MAALGDSVVADLVASEIFDPVVPVRKHQADYNLTELADLKVTVLSSMARFEPETRDQEEETFWTDVVLQQRVDTSNNTEGDALLDLMELVSERYKNRSLTASSKQFFCTGRAFILPSDTAISRSMLNESDVGHGPIRLTWRLLSAR
jgi:hypothetical protein